MTTMLKKDFTPEEWAERLKNSSYHRAKRGNREAWLAQLVKAVRPAFAERDIDLPANIRVTYGYPFNSRKAVGQCWQAEATADKHFEILISPAHEQADPFLLGATLVHELIHTQVRGHGKRFQVHMEALGLQGRPKATVGGVMLQAWLAPLLDDLGPFPGAEIVSGPDKQKKQGTRMLKCECPDCNFIFRASKSALEAIAVDGILACPSLKCSGRLELAQKDEA